MLSIFDRGHARTCQGGTRREFLRVGSLALGGLSLPELIAAKAATGDSTEHKAVVMLFLSGGPTQHETWDPKPDAPAEYRTLVDTIPTALPGVRFSKYFPKMAAAAKDFAIIRSFASNNGGHTYESVTTGGGVSTTGDGAGVGSGAGAGAGAGLTARGRLAAGLAAAFLRVAFLRPRAASWALRAFTALRSCLAVRRADLNIALASRTRCFAALAVFFATSASLWVAAILAMS